MGPRCTGKYRWFSSIDSNIDPSPYAVSMRASPSKRRGQMRSLRLVASLGALLVAGGCGIAPANLVATKPAVEACKVTQKPLAPQNSTPESRLQASLARVRDETDFPIYLAPPVSPDVIVTEATTLVTLARTRMAVSLPKGNKKGKQDKQPPDAPRLADPSENVLLDLLPWAGTTDPIQEEALDYVTQARTLIIQAGERVKTMNALLPPSAKFNATDVPTAAPGTDVTIASFNVVEHRKIFHNLTTLASFRAFHLLALLSAARLRTIVTTQPDVTDGQLDAEVRIFNVARYLSAYFDAYFRGGQFIEVSFDQKDFVATLATRIKRQLPAQATIPPTVQELDDTLQPAFDSISEKGFVQKLAAEFHGTLPQGGIGSLSAPQVQDLLQPVFDDLCRRTSNASNTCLSTTFGKSAFVTRAGLSVQFSGVSFAAGGKDKIGVSHTYPQVSDFGPQLIRVFVEALFDANGAHPPGVPNSTACDPDNHLFTGVDECVKPGDALEARRQRIDMLSAAAEALTSAGTGAIIRGGGWASLNNELVASLLETLAGVNARKISEKVLYVTSNREACPLTPVALRINGD